MQPNFDSSMKAKISNFQYTRTQVINRPHSLSKKRKKNYFIKYATGKKNQDDEFKKERKKQQTTVKKCYSLLTMWWCDLI